MEPVLHPATGESEPFSQKNPALSPEVEMASAARGPVEPVPLRAAGESEPLSQENPALSPGVEMAGAAREACGAGSPASRGGKCTKIAGIPGTFPEEGLRKLDDSDAGAAALDMLVGKRDHTGSNLQELTDLLLQHTGPLAMQYGDLGNSDHHGIVRHLSRA